jgi:RND family efflux transporter MFP subunit
VLNRRLQLPVFVSVFSRFSLFWVVNPTQKATERIAIMPAQTHSVWPSFLLLRGISCLLSLAILTACGSKDDEKHSVAPDTAPTQAARAALSVALVSPTQATLTRSIQADGNIAAWQEASVGAEMTGRIQSVKVQVGDTVKYRQELAQFMTAIETADHGQLIAAAAQASASYNEAQAAAARAHKLKEQGFMGEQMLAQYDTQAATAKARMEQAEAARNANALRLANGTVRATANGTISRVDAVAGSIVQAGTPLFRLIQDGRLEWRAQVTAAEMNHIQPGMPALISLGDGLQLKGKVRTVAPTVDAKSRTGLVYVDLEPSANARAGMYVNGHIQAGQNTALLLPQTALVLRDGFSYVMQVDAQNRIKQTIVQLGQRQGDAIEILSGLAENARVVAAGAAFLNDGDSVSVISAMPTTQPTKPEVTQAVQTAEPAASAAVTR